MYAEVLVALGGGDLCAEAGVAGTNLNSCWVVAFDCDGWGLIIVCGADCW
jgi:hypothetical protein